MCRRIRVNQCDRVSRVIADWMHSNRLQLNNGKSEFLWCTNSLYKHSSPSTPASYSWSDYLFFSCRAISYSPRVPRWAYLSIQWELVYTKHLVMVFQDCVSCVAFGDKCQAPCSSRSSLIVLSRLDYCNCMLVGLPQHLTQRLQSVQNAVATLDFGIRHSEVRIHYRRVSPLACRSCSKSSFWPAQLITAAHLSRGRVSLASPTSYLAEDSGPQLTTILPLIPSVRLFIKSRQTGFASCRHLPLE